MPVRVLIALLWVVPLGAPAHTPKLSSAEIALAGREADVVLTLNGTDLDAALALKLTAPDGRVHGFGFAGVLREYGIPRDALVPALAAFNLGVELGQIAIVIGVLLVLRALEAVVPALRPAPSQRLVYPVSAVVLVLGLFWAIERAAIF